LRDMMEETEMMERGAWSVEREATEQKRKGAI
jgi:hypothetical protein